MRIAVIGAGGVGGAFGAALAKADADVTFVARGAHLHRGGPRCRLDAPAARLERGDVLPVGTAVELVQPNGTTFHSSVKAVEAFHVSPPPPPGVTPVGIMLADDPGTVASGSELRPAP